MEEFGYSNRYGNGTLGPDGNLLRQLLGLCDGLVADGVLKEMEAGLLKSWLAADRTAPVSNLIARADMLVSKVIREGKLSEKERRELLEILEQECS